MKLNGIVVLDKIVPSNSENTYPTHESIYGKGGWREVSSIPERNKIAIDRRSNGMAVFVTETGLLYILNATDDQLKLPELPNEAWFVFNNGLTGSYLSSTNPSGTGRFKFDGIISASQNISAATIYSNGVSCLTEHQPLNNYYTKDEANSNFLSSNMPSGTGTLKIDNIILSSMVHTKTTEDKPIGLYIDNTSSLVYGTLEDVSMRTTPEGSVKPNILNVNYGIGNKITGLASFVAGNTNVVQGNYAVALNASTSALHNSTLAHGEATQATGNKSHAEGSKTHAIGEGSHAEGSATSAVGSMSHAEGTQTKALAERAHAEGYQTVADNIGAHAEGTTTSAAGPYTHTEGFFTYAVGEGAHTEGYATSAFNKYGHAEGINTIASGTGGNYQTDWQHVIGKFNEVKLNRPFIIGGGTSNTARKNIYEIDWNGNSYTSGIVSAASFSLQDGTLIDEVLGTAYKQLDSLDIPNKSNTIYAYTLTAMNQTFNLPTTIDNKYAPHFKLHVTTSNTNYGISFNQTLHWRNNVTPDLTLKNVLYLFVFEYCYSLNKWICYLEEDPINL